MCRVELLHTYRAFFLKKLYQVCLQQFGFVVDVIAVKDLLNYGYSLGRYVKRRSKILFGIRDTSDRSHCKPVKIKDLVEIAEKADLIEM